MVNSAFHSSNIDQMSIRNSCGLGLKKLSPHSSSVASRQANSNHVTMRIWWSIPTMWPQTTIEFRNLCLFVLVESGLSYAVPVVRFLWYLLDIDIHTWYFLLSSFLEVREKNASSITNVGGRGRGCSNRTQLWKLNVPNLY